jgi:hypothetical protein
METKPSILTGFDRTEFPVKKNNLFLKGFPGLFSAVFLIGHFV